MTAKPIDVVHLGLHGAISAYWIDGPEPAIVDPGPSTSLDGLEEGLAELGVGLSDIRHILLTHVHLDHAGGTGHLVSRFSHLEVHIHAEGAPHMADPERLVASTRRTFGESHDRLWGEVMPVPAERIRPWEPTERLPVPGVRAFATPGHISHHVSYLDEADGTFVAGDALGVILAPGAPTHPPTPPPSVDVPAWLATLDDLESVDPERFGVSHFGVHDNFTARLAELRRRLSAFRDRVEAALAAGNESDRDAYEREVREAISEFRPRDEVDGYFDAFKAAVDWDGMRLYLERAKRAEADRAAGGA
jgi:glyoxylase-like metal-dependent hydrolase (beta-lactamase superfamily II)